MNDQSIARHVAVVSSLSEQHGFSTDVGEIRLMRRVCLE